VLCKLDVEKAYDHVNWSFLNIYAPTVWILGKMEKVDNVL